MSSYTYLLKYIIIGDPSTASSILRCGQVLRAHAIPTGRFQVRQWDDDRRVVRVEDSGCGWEEGEDADLGYGTVGVDSD